VDESNNPLKLTEQDHNDVLVDPRQDGVRCSPKLIEAKPDADRVRIRPNTARGTQGQRSQTLWRDARPLCGCIAPRAFRTQRGLDRQENLMSMMDPHGVAA